MITSIASKIPVGSVGKHLGAVKNSFSANVGKQCTNLGTGIGTAAKNVVRTIKPNGTASFIKTEAYNPEINALVNSGIEQRFQTFSGFGF